MHICSHLLKKFLMEKFIFCAQICASKQTENYCKEEITHFQLLYSHFLKKNMQIFYRSVFRCKVLGAFVFYLFEVQSRVLVSSSAQEENVLIQQLFLTREGKELLRYFYKIAKVVFAQNINIGSTTKINCRQFHFFIVDVK